MSLQRIQSGKIERHKQAIAKYQEYENSKQNQVKLNDMIKGKKTTPMIPMPGQFLCVASDKPLGQMKFLEIPLTQLLDETRSFTELKLASMERKKIQSQSQPKRQTQITSAVLKQSSNKLDSIVVEEDLELLQKEFGIESTTQPQFTKSLRQIIRKQHKQLLSPTRRVIKDAIEQKMEKLPELLTSTSTKNIDSFLPALSRQNQSAASIRPISGNYILKALKLDKSEPLELAKGIQTTQKQENREELKQAKLRNFYAPQKDDKNEIKHIMGYQTINLTSKDFIQTFDIEYAKERDRKILEKHFQTSAVDPRLQSPYIRTDNEAQKKIQAAQDARGELDLIKKRKAMFMAEPTQGNGVFLPLDYYLIEEQHGQELLDRYSVDGQCDGFSKWFDTKGQFTWEECKVVSYSNEVDQYEVEWIKNGKKKLVTRVNLRFKLEDKTNFTIQLTVAEFYRKRSEVFILRKYNYMIDQMEDQTSSVSPDQLYRIQLFMLGCLFKMGILRDPVQFYQMQPSLKFNFKRNLIPHILQNSGKTLQDIYKEKGFKQSHVQDILLEIKSFYVRANHQITFDYSLPFSEEKQTLFRGYLPDYIFMTPQEQKESKPQPIYPSFGIGTQTFLDLYKVMNRVLHQAIPKKLSTLSHTQITLLKFQEFYIFQNEFVGQQYNFKYKNRPITLVELQRQQRYRCQDTIRDFQSRMYDIHFEIMDMVDEEVKLLKKQEAERLRLVVLEAERKQIQEQDLQSETLALMKQFQQLINARFERSLRDCWGRSVYNYIGFLQQISDTFDHVNSNTKDQVTYDQVHKYAFDLEFKPFKNELLLQIEIVMNEKDYSLSMEPTAESWKLQLTDAISLALHDITQLQTMRTREIGSAREDQLLHIFEDLGDYLITEPRYAFNRLLNRLFQMLHVYFVKLQEFSFIMEYVPEKKLKKSNYEDFSRELERIKTTQQAIKKYMFKKNMRIGIFWIDCEKYLHKCLQRVDEASKELYELLITKIGKENQKIEVEIMETIEKLKYEPKNIEELHDLRVYARDTLPSELKLINQKINQVMEKMTLTELMHYEITYEDFSKSWSIYGMPLKLLRRQDKCLTRLQNEEKGFQEDLMLQQGEMQGDISFLQKELDLLMLEHDIGQMEQISNKFTDLGERIEKASQEGEIINRRETMLKWKITDYQEIIKIKKLFSPYSKVWTLARDYNFKIRTALTGGLGNVKREELLSDVQEGWSELFKLEKTTFKIVQHMLLVIQHVRKQYEEVKPYLPVINDLLNPALKKRHWKHLKEMINELDDDLNVPFETLKIKVMDLKEEIRDISEKASKEMGFEKAITKMRNDWKHIRFEMALFRDTGTYLLKAIDPIFDKLDEDISKTMSISSSPFVKFLENDVKMWSQTLFRVQETIELWCKVQKSWQYLQPIFFSEDIIREMPKEGTKYQVVDKMWKMIMQSTHVQPIVMEACFQNRIKENFQYMFDQLDQVTKGLNEFLNKKRQAFPRFYFLSNEELLQILAQAREPRAVQKHLNKCFEGIDWLTFLEIEDTAPKVVPREDTFAKKEDPMKQKDNSQDEEPDKPQPYPYGLLITEMCSRERETIKLTTIINPLDKNQQVRGVEEWLNEIQQIMKTTLKLLMPQSAKQCLEQPLEKVIKEVPSQMIICSYEIIFTQDTTLAIVGQLTSNVSLSKHQAKTKQMLLNTVALLREGSWSKIQIQTLGVLVVLQVKQKDVVQDILDKDVKSIENFDWMSQMRYYFNKKGELEVRILHCNRNYGYEYLGQQSRLVITPLTDRCYRTLMASLHMNMGGAPEGPAGTGKTETTKDLSKAIAKHCVVFNCSDQLDYLAMGKFFKGLVSCGSWACFDEFNRIELEVLSVIAQQILNIQTAIIRESSSKIPIKIFTFEGVQLSLDSSCAIFITMNPGYQGRSELPDNLKALFRSVAMMIPNYAMITEISLYSYGFTKARQLSVKITSSLKLASEQLSTQSHYDFGMRAVKSIIVAAGQLKRDYKKTTDEEDEAAEDLLVLRAIEDCNLPKFTVKDVPLFQAIISDLFPSIEPSVRDYNHLGQAIVQVIEESNLTYTEVYLFINLQKRFYLKIIQLYETINVRHGLMVVGGTISGKTTIINTLANSFPLESVLIQKQDQELLSRLKREKLEQEQSAENLDSNEDQLVVEKDQEDITTTITQPIKPLPESKVVIHRLNPKSISSRLLYGDVEESTNEWQDGITAIIFRECQEDAISNNWILFDGPVDALWIENMNTVLDDNKKLCLTNGETIKLTDTMHIIFEVEDLLEASPATVSRCGMVYLEPQQIGWQVLFTPWFSSLTPNFKTEQHQELFQSIYLFFLQKSFDFIESQNLRTMYVYSKEWIGLSCLRLFYAFILKHRTIKKVLQDLEEEQEKEIAKQKALEMEGKTQTLKKPVVMSDKDKTELIAHFIISVVWSAGALIDEDRRKYFSDYLIQEIKLLDKVYKGIGKEIVPPPDVTLYEIWFDFDRKNWNLWNNRSEQRISKDVAFHEIYIPTTDSQRNNGLLKQLLLHNYPVLFYGKTGTGKTMVVKRFLLNELDPNQYLPTITAFSANTSCVQVLDILESKLEKQKRRKGVYGPLVGTTNLIFIDDLNMPLKEQYGAQPPLELVRQWFCQGGWYDKKTLECKQIMDIMFCGAMGVGRAQISQRLIRHFNMIFVPEMDSMTLKTIVSKICDWGFDDYVDKVKFVAKNLPSICYAVYAKVGEVFLPLPKKSHYLFNLRDLMKVVQGVLLVPASRYEATGDSKTQLLRLWVHESICVYSDRLIDQEDKLMFEDILNEVLELEFNVKLTSILENQDDPDQPQRPKSLLYGNFMEAHSIMKSYQELNNYDKLHALIEESVSEYNQFYPKQRIALVLFDDAIQFLAKVNRIISQPFGNALFVGLGGTGCRTLSRLAAFMQDYSVGEPDLQDASEWYDFLRDLLKQVGLRNKSSIFLVSDSQITHEKFLEDLNNILNIGEIPNLYNAEDKEALLSDLTEETDKERLQLSPLQLWEYFVKRCKMNLHLVLYLSPVGDKLKTRIRNFPSLISCTSTIWVQPWSQTALKEVAIHFLQHISQEDIDKVANVCVGLHHSVQQETQVYAQQAKKYFYVTPLSYMKLLQTFQLIFEAKRISTEHQRDTYLGGVKMLDQCGVIVGHMAIELDKLQPFLVQKTIETEEIMKNVEIETAVAEKQRIIVQSDEVDTKVKADIAAEIATRCQDRLSEAIPQLEEALNALKTLKVGDFVEMKSFLNPPKLIRLTMDSVCIMMERKPKKGTDGSDDYWEEAKKLLSDPQKFIKMLESYKRNQIPEKVIQKMTQFLAINKQFNAATIAKASQAAEGLCKWVIAIFNYHHVYKAIQPLREDLDKANATLKEASDELKKKQNQLQEVEQKCQDLRDCFENENFQKQKLKAQITDCEIKMKRALELTGGLSGEKMRWRESGEKLNQQVIGLLGDMLLAVGYLSYMGAFTAVYRNKILEEKWIPLVKQQQVPCSKQFSLVDCLSSQLEVQEWILNGLPLDDVSRENAIIMKNADSYPLIIDPQVQASKFIQRQEKRGDKQDGFVMCKMEKRFPQVLEQCIKNGYVMMLQNVGQTLDSMLEPILLKQYQTINNKQMVQVGMNTVEVHPNFRLYLITSLSNPHYTPSVLTKVTLINFTITQEALKDQMTSILVREEEPQLEEEKIRIMNDSNEYKIKMQLIETNILQMLQQSDGAKMLQDEKLVQSLQESKVTSEDINQRLKEAKVTEERIYINRQNYELLSRFASNIYFTLLQLGRLDPMYQFSLEFYLRIFKKAIKSAERPTQKNIKQRVGFISESLKRVVYFEICRSIFVRDKNLFAFMLLITWLDSNNQIDQQELQFLLNGLPLTPILVQENPDPQLFSPMQWTTLLNLTTLPAFQQLAINIQDNQEQWAHYLQDPIDTDIPKQFERLSPFSRLLIIRASRLENFGKCMRDLINKQLGTYFTQSLVVTLDNSFADSSMTIPLIYVLQPGDDPQEEVKKYAQEKSRILSFVSLGKGQGEAAEKAILECLGAGTWVILQNCHLAVSWLPHLEVLLEYISQELQKKDKEREIKTNSEFRLWLSTMSTDKFPQQLLMDSVKMTKDPPKGVKANIAQIYSNQNSTKPERAFYSQCDSKTGEWKQLYLSLCYFHAIVRERRRYGPVGWNILYDFNDSDFRISVRQLKQMLQDYEEIPFTALIYLTGECYYGGKVTDDFDRRVLKELLSSFYRMDIFYDGYKFSSEAQYYIPDVDVLDTLESSMEFIQELPDISSPGLFGLHPNAAITQAQLETSQLIQSLVIVGLVESGGTALSQDKNKIMLERAQELLNRIPHQFDMVQIGLMYKIEYYESMNTVLIQELLRYNNLLKILSDSLKDLIKAAQGLVVMTQELDQIGEALLNNILPPPWKSKSYPSLKPLLNYWLDLIERIKMFRDWIKDGPPSIFWVPGFYFTQSFFTGVMQNYARKHKIPIDQLKFGFQVITEPTSEAPQEGVYIHGLFLEAAQWNKQEGCLDEAVPNQIYQDMPIIWLVPESITDHQSNENDYLCPVYKTSERKGTLSTTGHSTNFVLSIQLKTKLNPSHWVKRGTALISQLNE